MGLYGEVVRSCSTRWRILVSQRNRHLLWLDSQAAPNRVLPFQNKSIIITMQINETFYSSSHLDVEISPTVIKTTTLWQLQSLHYLRMLCHLYRYSWKLSVPEIVWTKVLPSQWILLMYCKLWTTTVWGRVTLWDSLYLKQSKSCNATRLNAFCFLARAVGDYSTLGWYWRRRE